MVSAVEWRAEGFFRISISLAKYQFSTDLMPVILLNSSLLTFHLSECGDFNNDELSEGGGCCFFFFFCCCCCFFFGGSSSTNDETISSKPSIVKENSSSS